MTRGRPTLYTPEIAEEICERLAAGESLLAICRDEHMPAESTVRDWALADREGFSAKYAHARLLQAHRMADEIVDMSDDKNTETNRSRLQVDTRKWILSKVLPKIYGEKLTVGGDPDNPVEIKVTRTIVYPDGDD